MPRIGTQTLEGASLLGFSLNIGATGSHVPCRSSKSGSRRLHTGRRLGSKQVSPRLIPGSTEYPGFDAVSMLSMLHQRFILIRLPDSYLTGSLPRLSLDAHHHGSLPQQRKVV